MTSRVWASRLAVVLLFAASPAWAAEGQTTVVDGQTVRWFTLEQAEQLVLRLKECKLLDEELVVQRNLVLTLRGQVDSRDHQLQLADQQVGMLTAEVQTLAGQVAKLEDDADHVYWWAAGGFAAGVLTVVLILAAGS